MTTNLAVKSLIWTMNAAVVAARLRIENSLHGGVGPGRFTIRLYLHPPTHRGDDDQYGKEITRILPETQIAKRRLIAAEKSYFEEAVHNGLITQQSAGKLIEPADQELDKLSDQGK